MTLVASLWLIFRRYEDDFAGLDEFEFFAGKLFNHVGVGAKSLDFGCELFVFVAELSDFVFDGAEFFGLGTDLKDTFVVEYGQQKHRDREKAEHWQCDSNDNTLHQASVIHSLPYSNNFSRSAVDEDSA